MTLEYLLNNHEDIELMYDKYVKDHKQSYYSNKPPMSIWEFIEELEECSCGKWTDDIEETPAHGRKCESCRNDL